jgi:hypothetical protein
MSCVQNLIIYFGSYIRDLYPLVSNCFELSKIYLAFNFKTYDKQKTPWNRVLPEKLIVAHLAINSPPFMEPEIALPYSQQSATGPHPAPD